MLFGTLVHEAAHHHGADDHAYGEDFARGLSQAQALDNADSYALAIGRLVRHVQEGGRDVPWAARCELLRPAPKLKGSIGEGPNHSNFSDESSVNNVSELRKFC